MAKYSTKLLKAFFRVIVVTACSHCCQNEQDKELDKDAGTFQEVEDQDDVADSKQGEVVCTE